MIFYALSMLVMAVEAHCLNHPLNYNVMEFIQSALFRSSIELQCYGSDSVCFIWLGGRGGGRRKGGQDGWRKGGGMDG